MKSFSFFENTIESRQRGFIVGLLLFFVLLSMQYTFKVTQHGSRSAINRWREQIVQVEEVDIYKRFEYPNPPIMALLLEGLAELPPLAGCLCWFYAKVGMTLLSFYWVFRLIENPEAPFPTWAKMLTVILSIRPIMGDLLHGNVNLFILFLVVGALFAFSRGKDVVCGIFMGLAIACKVTPALFLPYFLWKRAWKAAAGCVAGLALFLLIVPGVFLGMQRNFDLLTSWTTQMVKPFVVSGIVTSEHNNQSLPGLVFRMVTHSPSFSTYVDDKYTPVEYHNLLELDPFWARLLVKGCMAAFVGVVLLVCRTPTTPRRNWRLAAEFSLVVLGMLLFSERTWKHHCVTLLLPIATVLYYLATCAPAARLRKFLIGSLIAVEVLMASTSTGLLDFYERGAKVAQVYGTYVWAYCVLVAALSVVLWHGKKKATVAVGLPLLDETKTAA